MRTATIHRKWATATAAVVAVSFLAACTPEIPPVNVDSEVAQAPGPVLHEDQSVQISQEIGDVLAAADKEMDAGALESRITGPALGIRKAEYQIAKFQKKPESITELPTQLQSVFMTSTETWPRTFFAVSERPQNLEAERFVVMTQEDARADYKLWAWFTLFPGVTVPVFPAADSGTPDLTEVDESLSLTPQAALEQYTDLLKTGDKSEFKDVFNTEGDGFIKEIADRRKTLEDAAKIAKGTYKETFTVGEDLKALRTLDGGAVIVGTITTSGTLQGEKGAIITPSETEKAFLPKDAKASNALTVNRTAIVGIYVPAKGEEVQPAAIGRTIRTTGAEIPKE